MFRCSFCGTVITSNNEKDLWNHIKTNHNKVFEEIKNWQISDMINECYENVENETAELYKAVKEVNDLVKKIRDERNHFLLIAYNAICLGQLDEIFDENRLIKELGCTKEEYKEIME